jgi:hypothetical protein
MEPALTRTIEDDASTDAMRRRLWWRSRPPEPLLSPPLLTAAIAACKERLLDTTRPVDVRLEAVDALTFLEHQRGLGHYASEALTMEKIQQVFMMGKKELADGGR